MYIKKNRFLKRGVYNQSVSTSKAWYITNQSSKAWYITDQSVFIGKASSITDQSVFTRRGHSHGLHAYR